MIRSQMITIVVIIFLAVIIVLNVSLIKFLIPVIKVFSEENSMIMTANQISLVRKEVADYYKEQISDVALQHQREIREWENKYVSFRERVNEEIKRSNDQIERLLTEKWALEERLKGIQLEFKGE